MTTIIMRTSEGDMRMMLLLWDATSLKIVEIPIKTTLNNPDFPKNRIPEPQDGTLSKITGIGNYSFF